MATIKEYTRGINGDQDRRFIRYLVEDAATDNAALDQLEMDAPLFYDNMPRENITIQEISKRLQLWEGTAQYTRRSGKKPAQDTNSGPLNVTGPSEPSETSSDKEHFSFDVSVERVLETYPINQSTYNQTTNPDGQRLAIVPGWEDDTQNQRYEEMPFAGFNFDPEYGFRGVELLRPRKSFSLSIFPEDSKVTRAYQLLVEDAVGTVSSTRFRGHDAGTVMLMSARGDSRNSGDWQFDFTFEYRPVINNADFGNGCKVGAGNPVLAVLGFDRIEPYWVWRTVDFNGKPATIRVCRQITIWRDYKFTDFSTIFI